MVQKQLDFLGFDFYAATFPENRKIPPGTRGVLVAHANVKAHSTVGMTNANNISGTIKISGVGLATWVTSWHF